MSKINDLTIDINTAHFAHILRAISRHARALADELDVIRNTICPQCGERLLVNRKDVPMGMVFVTCPRCDYAEYSKSEFYVDDDDTMDYEAIKKAAAFIKGEVDE